MSEDFENLKKELLRTRRVTEAAWDALNATTDENSRLTMLTLFLQLFQDRLNDFEKRLSNLERETVRYVGKPSGGRRKKQEKMKVPKAVEYV